MEDIKEIVNRIKNSSFPRSSTPQVPDKVVECKKCNDTGFIPSNNAFAVCKCVEAKRLKKLYDSAGISKAFSEKTFGNFQTEKKPEIIKAAKEICMSYVKGFDGKSSLALLGQVGAGKTHLCIAIANNLLKKNVGVLYMQYREAITQLKQNMIDDDTYQREIKKYKTSEVLYIDDLYKGLLKNDRPNQSDIRIMFEIINYRYLNQKPILISSEYTADKLADFDEAVGSRIIEMCKGFIVEFEGAGLNYRLYA